MLTGADKEKLKGLTPKLVEVWLTANGFQRSPGTSWFCGIRAFDGRFAHEFPALMRDVRHTSPSLQEMEIETIARFFNRHPDEILREMLAGGNEPKEERPDA